MTERIEVPSDYRKRWEVAYLHHGEIIARFDRTWYAGSITERRACTFRELDDAMAAGHSTQHASLKQAQAFIDDLRESRGDGGLQIASPRDPGEVAPSGRLLVKGDDIYHVGLEHGPDGCAHVVSYTIKPHDPEMHRQWYARWWRDIKRSAAHGGDGAASVARQPERVPTLTVPVTDKVRRALAVWREPRMRVRMGMEHGEAQVHLADAMIAAAAAES